MISVKKLNVPVNIYISMRIVERNIPLKKVNEMGMRIHVKTKV